jgi:hypothetical protein
MAGVALLLLLTLGPTTIAQREGTERARTEESFIVAAVTENHLKVGASAPQRMLRGTPR